MVRCPWYYSARDTARDARFTVVPPGYTGYMYCVSARARAGRKERVTGEVSTMPPLWPALSELAYSVRWVVGRRCCIWPQVVAVEVAFVDRGQRVVFRRRCGHACIRAAARSPREL